MNGIGKIGLFLAFCGIGAATVYVYLKGAGQTAGGGAAGPGGDNSPLGGASSSTEASVESVIARVEAAAKAAAYTVGIYSPRGLRNNNPGNLRYSAAVQWNGQTGQDSDGYAVFDSAEHGVRAMGHQLQTYFGRGESTVQSIISTWAPSSENDTQAYINDVCSKLGVGPADDVSSMLPQLCAAMIFHENGVQPFADSDLETWVSEA